MNLKKTRIAVFGILTVCLVAYALVPNPPFPSPPPGSLQSDEPADTETSLRRAYFTNSTREEVIQNYMDQLNLMPILRLNYPPEEAQTIIRDQTRSTYLEELSQPLRLSVYINGFEPKEEKDAILIKGNKYEEKITVRYVPSNRYLRAVFALFIGLFSFLIYESSLKLIKRLVDTVR